MLGWQRVRGKGGVLPPEGALCHQKSGKTFQKLHVVPGPGGRRPVAVKDACMFYLRYSSFKKRGNIRWTNDR